MGLACIAVCVMNYSCVEGDEWLEERGIRMWGRWNSDGEDGLSLEMEDRYC